MELAGKVVLITGSARGLGRSFAEALLSRGAKVCISDANQELGEKTLADLQTAHSRENVAFAPCDVTKDDQFTAAWDTCVAHLGPVDILINNAGVGNEQNWALTMDVNLGGCIRGTLMAFDRLSKSKGGTGGAVVNISSIAALKVVPLGPVYAASKSGIVGFSRTLGHDFHYSTTGIKVQCLCPSLVETCFLADSAKTAFSPQVAMAMQKTAGSIPLLKPATVAEALVKLLEEGKNGGVMVVEQQKEPYYVEAALT